jgi:hypothetical protein
MTAAEKRIKIRITITITITIKNLSQGVLIKLRMASTGVHVLKTI